MPTRRWLMLGASGFAASAILGGHARALSPSVVLSEDAWRKRLTPAQFNILRQAGTEMPFSSPLDLQFAPGRYDCVGCGQKLFSSHTKYDSHTGWPSFYAPIDNAVVRASDDTLGMTRTEVHCARCAGHLGHVFDDGPRPTGERFCMNGIALNFVPGAAA